MNATEPAAHPAWEEPGICARRGMTTNSRLLTDLHPRVAAKAQLMRDLAAEAGLEIIILSTLRDAEAQAARYALGRTVPGPNGNASRPLGQTVTNDEPGKSLHHLGLAFDVWPLMAGLPVVGRSSSEWPAWALLGRIASDPRVALTWGFNEDIAVRPQLRRIWHFQYTAGLEVGRLLSGEDRVPDPPGLPVHR